MIKKTAIISIIVSIFSIIITIFINFKIAMAYLNSDGKTRGLFGIVELLQFGFQHYMAILGVGSLILAFSGKNESKHLKKCAIIFSILAIVVVFVRIWRLFVLPFS
jgi:hypothetical protein